MSTVKATYIQHPSASSPNFTLAADGSVSGGAGLGGLVHIHTESVSSQTTISIDECFSAIYDSYLVLMDLLNTSNATFTMRLRASAADDTGSNYRRTFHGNDQTTTGGTGNYFSGTSWDGALYAYAVTGSSSVILHRPFLADETHGSFTTNALELSTPLWINRVGAFHHTQSVSYDGFTLATASGTLNGSVSVYGYRKS